MNNLYVLLLLTTGFLVAYSADEPDCVSGQPPSNSSHADRCDKYYACDGENGTRSLEQCPPRWMFDAGQKLCRPANSAVDCSNRPDSDPASENLVGKPRPKCMAGGSGVQYHPHEYYCNHYYQCNENGTETMGTCPDGLYFDIRGPKDKLSCLRDNYGLDPLFHCIERPLRARVPKPECPKNTKLTLADDKKDCDAYSVCRNSERSAQFCFDGKIFQHNYTDYPMHICAYPHKVNLTGRECDMKRMERLYTCPQVAFFYPLEWALQVLRFLLPFRVQQFSTWLGLRWLAHPRIHTGHCRYFVDCSRTDGRGIRQPESGGCDHGQVLEPNTLLCVSPGIVKECKDYYYIQKYTEDYKRDLAYNLYNE